MTDLPFAFVDVFAEAPLEGNPLAVVPDADALDERTLRAIAREFNQAETTFLVAADADADIRLRSFTATGTEVLGAGHNALGAWLWLADSGRLPHDRTVFTQQIGDEVGAVEIDRSGDRVRVVLDQEPPTIGKPLADQEALAAALGLRPDELVPGSAVVSRGVGHVLVRAASADAVARVRVDQEALAQFLRPVTDEGCAVFSTEGTDAGIAAVTRFFNPLAGIAEDIATGTAAGPLAALLVAEGRAETGQVVRIAQGVELGRPSALEVIVEPGRVRLGGSGLVVATGTLRV